MKFELLIFGMTAFFVANTYYDGKYVLIMKSWKKYYQMAGIAFIGLSFYLFLKKYPSHTRNLFKHANGMIKYMPIDKDAGDLLKPFFAMSKSSMFTDYHGVGGGPDIPPQQKRMMNSGKKGTKRCVSETKKKYVAAEQGWKCGACKKQLPAWYEVDHVVRLDRGGSNHIDNLVALCRDCHGQKTASENL